MPRAIFDAHLNLARCAVSFNRDLTLSVCEIRRREEGMTDEPSRGKATVSLPELKKAGVAVAVVTLLARGGPEQGFKVAYKRTDLDHANQAIAHCAAQGQLAYYRQLEDQGQIRMIRTRGELR